MRTSPRSFIVAFVLSTAIAGTRPVAAQTYEVLLGFPIPHGSPASPLLAGPAGNLYGTTLAGGGYVRGSVFLLIPDGSGGFTRQNLHSFAQADGANLQSALIFGPDGNLYGAAHDGGASGVGTIFRMSPTGSFLRIHDFADGGGQHPSGLILGSDGNFYGVASGGGDHDAGTVFRLDPAEHVTVLHSFDPATEGRAPAGGLVQSGGFLYGTTSLGGASDEGTIFRIDLAGALTTLHEFTGADGAGPLAAMILVNDGKLYGTTTSGGSTNGGTIFHIDSAGTFGMLHDFTGDDGYYPQAALFQASDGKLYGACAAALGGGKDVFPAGTLYRVDTAGNFEVIHTFDTGLFGDGPGSAPLAALIDGHDGFLYSTTLGASMVYRVDLAAQFAYVGDVVDPGTYTPPYGPVTEIGGAVYGVIPSSAFTPSSLFRLQGNSFTVVHTFGGAGDGDVPDAGLLRASDGNLYGATSAGGLGLGTIYQYSPATDTYAKIHDFVDTESRFPNGNLTEGAPGVFYGTTVGDQFEDLGTVFSTDASGTVTIIHRLTSDEINLPIDGPAVAPNGDLWAGGTGPGISYGSLFSVTSLGVYTHRYDFDLQTDGYGLDGTLLWATDGRLYGETSFGGPGSYGAIYRYEGPLAITILKAFTGDADGATPIGGLVQATDGNFYGVTGGETGVANGTIFRMNSADDTLSTLHTFAYAEGIGPNARISEGDDGAFYGATQAGGYGDGGVIYRFSLGSVVPSIAGVAPTSGRAAGGTPIIVSGEHLFHVGSVSVGGVAATSPFSTDQASLHTVSPPLAPGALYDVAVDQANLPAAWFADFADVDQGDIFHSYVETIFRNGITAGCGGGSYCRNASVTRAQMAVFLLKSEHGSSYVPPACQGTFPDVACPSTFADWIEQLAAEGVTAGCGGGLYCPDAPVTRRQMAVFLLKTKEGSAYAPPPAIGVFDDVPVGDPNAPWIEELYHRDITGGCQLVPLLYCPDQPNTRGQMAVFLTKTFELQ